MEWADKFAGRPGKIGQAHRRLDRIRHELPEAVEAFEAQTHQPMYDTLTDATNGAVIDMFLQGKTNK